MKKAFNVCTFSVRLCKNTVKKKKYIYIKKHIFCYVADQINAGNRGCRLTCITCLPNITLDYLQYSYIIIILLAFSSSVLLLLHKTAVVPECCKVGDKTLFYSQWQGTISICMGGPAGRAFWLAGSQPGCTVKPSVHWGQAAGLDTHSHTYRVKHCPPGVPMHPRLLSTFSMASLWKSTPLSSLDSD